MSLITIISIIVVVFAVVDCVTDNMPRLQSDIYKLAFATTYILFTIKYYYGPDIYNYVPHYDEVPALSAIIAGRSVLPEQFEAGYELFCSACKQAGCSFWMMTAVVSTLYFYSINQLLMYIDRRRTFALMVIVVLDSGLIHAMLRQCMAVSCFILLVIALQKRDYLKGMVYAVLVVAFHKSGLFVVVPTLLFVLFQNIRVPRYVFGVLCVGLVFFLFVPYHDTILGIADFLDLAPGTRQSIAHHLELRRTVQVIFILYLLTLLCLNQWTASGGDSRIPTVQVAAILGLIIIVVLYRYFFVLNRLRSYFIPIIAVYVINKVQAYERSGDRLPYAKLVKQISVVFCFVYMGHQIYAFEALSSNFHSGLYNRCTVLELMTTDKAEIVKRQMEYAEVYWDEDNMSHGDNKISGKGND